MSSTFSPQRMRDARMARGLSPEHVAIAVGRTSFTVRAWESGKITPPTAALGELASVLGVTVDGLFAAMVGGDDAAA